MQIKTKYLNSQPLKFSVVPKYTTNSRSVKKDQELIVRIDFPQGYYIPIEHRGVECDFWEASCDASFKVEQNKRFDLGHSEEKNGITISTEDSFVAFGIGS